MKTVRAKFRCDSITEHIDSKEAKFNAVVGRDGENADFTKATPSGEMRMLISKDAAANTFFEVGKSYYFDIIEAEQ